MKVLIWTVVGFSFSLFLVNLKKYGILLGGIPTFIFYSIEFWIARFLSQKWDEHKLKKYLNNITAEANAQGMSTIEYFLKDVPQGCIETCENLRGKTKELKAFLNPYMDDKQISKYVYIYLFKKYRK